MTDERPFGADEARALFADELPIIGVGKCFLDNDPNSPVPVIAVDATNRPDLLDLGRVMRLEPAGATAATLSLRPFFHRPEGFVALTVTLTSPVSCSLKLIFRLPQQSMLAHAVVAAQRFVVSVTPIDTEGNFDAARGIVLNCTDPTGVVDQAIEQVDRWRA